MGPADFRPVSVFSFPTLYLYTHLRGFLIKYLNSPPGIPDERRGHIFLTSPYFLRRGDFRRRSVKTSDGACREILKCFVERIPWVTMKQAVVVVFQNAAAGAADIFPLLNIPGVGTVPDAATRRGRRGVDRATRPGGFPVTTPTTTRRGLEVSLVSGRCTPVSRAGGHFHD